MKVYLLNPESGAPIKNWWDGNDRWSLDVGEVKAFPEGAAEKLRNVYAFLQVVSLEEYEARLAKLESQSVAKIKVSDEGQLVPKTDEEIEAEKALIAGKKEKIVKEKKMVASAEDAKPDKPNFWELSRGDLINECNKLGIDVKGLGKKGVKVTKEALINLLENA